MVFLKRSLPGNSKRRPSFPSQNLQPSVPAASDVTLGPDSHQDNMSLMISLLAEAGCTLSVSGDSPPSLPADPHKLRRHIENRLSSDPSIAPRFLSGLSSYVQNPQNLRRVLIPASHYSGGSSWIESLARVLLLVAPIQPQILDLLLGKLPEYFNADIAHALRPLKDDISRLIVNQLRWLDFIVDSDCFAEKLMEVLSISPTSLKKEIIGSLPEIIGEKSHTTVVLALEKMLLEDSEIIVPVLDSFSNLNLNEQLQERAITIALSCIRTVDAEKMPHLLRFLFLSTTPANTGRIISQIRDQLKFVGAVDPHSARNKKLKENSLAESTDALILDALRSSLRFKNILCEAILKELKSIDQPRHHKVIDVWFLMLIYNNGRSLQKDVQKILKKKILDGCFSEALFDQCITGHRELVKDYFPSFISLCEYLLSCKEKQVRHFSIHLYTSLFGEFKDTYSKQEVVGALVTHIGSGIAHEVTSALDTLILLTSRYSEELIPISSHITGILDYMESFQGDNMHKVYEVFSRLALFARSREDNTRSSIANEVLMIIRKQVSNADMTYRKMGVIGTLKIVSTFGDVNAPSGFLSSQKSNSDDALELLRMSLDSLKLVPLTLILLYDELSALLEDVVLKPEIIEWIGKHVSEFEVMFLSDLEGGQLPTNTFFNDVEGELWINLDGDTSPVYLKILPLLSFSPQQQSESLQILTSQFLLLSVVERLTNQGSLGGIDALLGCPLLLPSSKYLSGVHWKKLTEKQKKTLCFTLFYAINWIRELLNAFSSQIANKVESITPNTKVETMNKLLKRLRNLLVMESILDVILKACPQSLPEVCFSMDQFGTVFGWRKSSERVLSEVIPPKKKKKHKPDPSASGNLGHHGKLRQPTIIDALKKSSMQASQEGSDEGSPRYLSHEKTPPTEHCIVGADELGVIDISAVPKFLDAQKSKFRPLNVDCLSLLCFSEVMDSINKMQLPLYLYILRDFRCKLDDFCSPSKQFPIPCPEKASTVFCRRTTGEFLNKIKPVFGSLRKHLDKAVSVLRSGSATCDNHWKSESCCAGNPVLSNLLVSETSVASSVFIEVLRCYNRILVLDELYHQKNMQILKDLLEAFHSTEVPLNYFSRHQQIPMPGELDYMYYDVYSFLEGILETSFLLSFSLASEVVVTLQTLVNPKIVVSCKFQETVGYVGCSQNALNSLRCRLSLAAHRLLVYDWSSKDTEWKSNGDIIQKILQIYLTNTECTSDLLNELACSILPQVHAK
ncbi:hypothetical protein KSP39_PZI000438 [Platanthera zijinensis]|uniref:Fanconi anemia group D2 protein n=1 Tax=Platanthera zijinensis TaxID=2320716 RepID=A0AAP0C697_9ASPA